jgi:hypothetical protein
MQAATIDYFYLEPDILGIVSCITSTTLSTMLVDQLDTNYNWPKLDRIEQASPAAASHMLVQSLSFVISGGQWHCGIDWYLMG